ncbi:hypothetical protein Bealeia2_02029 (plasmid) [Candidatus Bealeia paramacronuclearis]|nr:hypothetical protein [Candidatus Bealeia paramacronuclearis]
MLFDSESNKGVLDLKRSIADLVVQDKDDNKYIVEIERSFTPNFCTKRVFRLHGSSWTVFLEIRLHQHQKVFHISLALFCNADHESSLSRTDDLS